jgi:hypothetical protein
MRIWCVPSATELESPKLPPRIERNVYLRSPPPPPRLSKEQKLARGVIVLKNHQNHHRKKIRKPSSNSSNSSSCGRSKSAQDNTPPSGTGPPPPPPRTSPSSSSSNSFGSLPKAGSVLGPSSKNSYRNKSSLSVDRAGDFKAHMRHAGSGSSSLILHPGTSKTRQKKIKKRKKGKHGLK